MNTSTPQERETGWYWAKIYGVWGPYFWTQPQLAWILVGSYMTCEDSDFDEIGERIIRQQPVSKEAIKAAAEEYTFKGNFEDLPDGPLEDAFTAGVEWLQSQNTNTKY